MRDLLNSKMDDSVSSLHVEKDRGINNLIISSVLLSIGTTRSDIHKIVAKTLLKIQETRLGVSAKEVTDKALAALLKSGILRVKDENSKEAYSKLDSTVIFPTQMDGPLEEESPVRPGKKKKKRIILVNSTELELCPLGRAAMKGNTSFR